ncbi:3327_t:CDS:2, partial [Cetraspora pellucida]
ENSEYNSNSGDDLPNLIIDKQQILQYFYASENVQSEEWIIQQEYLHCYRYFHNLPEFEIWHKSISENQHTFYEVIQTGQSQKIKFDQKSTEVTHKKDKIYLYIKNALRIVIKEITGLNLSKDDLLKEEVKKPKNESVLREKSDTAIKIVEKQSSFLSYRNSSNGFDTFDKTLLTICLICEKEHMRKGKSGIEVIRVDNDSRTSKKKKVILHLDRLKSQLQHILQSHSQNNFTAIGKNIKIYNAKIMRSYNSQAKLTSNNWHLMLIKGHCGVGKSNKTTEKIKTLCHSDGFKSYLELDIKKLNLKDTLKLIISSESIYKLEATGYDIIILDKFETIT